MLCLVLEKTSIWCNFQCTMICTCANFWPKKVCACANLLLAHAQESCAKLSKLRQMRKFTMTPMFAHHAQEKACALQH